ncbi:Fibronectin type III domain-containing protein [Arthrobacter subterraneus]|uniref:Fibronectin type III domain-containing protein n=1 Tax=Arthrobacter subterraneus TaxID=335973 RepID=A0A1G8MUE3_9MICC|nr:S8 family serine peptidase [Arthrobacter subterraneus]SDI71658.1 Fibronectin type III domain-containing protein [Arthrobacter subterraneus]
MRPSFRALTAATITAVALSAFVPGAATAAPATGEDPVRYLVRYAPGTDVAAAAASLRKSGKAVGRTFSTAVRAAVITTTPAQAAALATAPNVVAVEQDLPVRISNTQSNAPWGLDRSDQRTLPLSSTYTPPAAGAGVNVYVVDTGVLASHADFGGRVAAGYTTIADGRGSSDCNGHGTHVAGTVAGTTYGIAKSSTVIPVRVLNCDGGGYMSDVVAGLDWVAAHHAAGVPAVVNLSLGGGANSTVDAALQSVINDGVTAAVAAGNSAVDACTSSPARVSAALTVAASDSSDRQASFSNTGSCVDLYAPGVGIASAYHTSNTAVATLNGTSMASPHVAGAAAVVLSQNPALTPAQVATNITGASTTGAIAGASTGTPNRLLYVGTGTTTTATKPAAATNVKATAGSKSAKVTWTKGSDGGSPLTGQTLYVYSGTSRIAALSVSASVASVTVTGLRSRSYYSFSVVATNKLGSSPESARSNTVRAR